MSPHAENTPHAPETWYVPGYYRDAQGHSSAKRGLQDDANAAYTLALCYRMTDEEPYAEGAARLIDAWATQVKMLRTADDSKLSFSYHFPALVFAADLITGYSGWSLERQQAFSQFVHDRAISMNTMDRGNNWGNWGLSMSMAIAVYLDDGKLFAKGIERWKWFIEHQIAEDGHMHHEVKRNGGRSGLWYSNFSLLPQVIACEVAKVRGVDLYDYKSKSGRTLRQAFEKLAPWLADPKSFPYWKGDPGKLHGVTYVGYFELLNIRWPNKAASELLKKARPCRTTHGAPFLTFTHGDLGPEGG